MLTKRCLSLAAISLMLAACTPAAPASPTTASKPAATAAPAAKAAESKPAPTSAPAKPAATAAPKAETKPAAKPAAKAASDYFAGKTITFIAGSSPGGGTDTINRTIARHLGRFIPGNPNIIVQNMPGAGGLIALNHMVNNVKPDGLTFNGSISQTLLFAQIQGAEQVRYDLTKLSWVGSAVDDSQVLWLRTDTPYTDLDAVRSAATPPKLGAQSGTHSSVVLPKIVEEVTGLKFNVVTGYPGSPEIFLDVERGALDGRFASLGSLKTQRPDWLPNNFVRVLMSTSEEPLADFPDVPLITQVVPEDRRALLALVRAPQSMNRSMAGPPGIPADVLQTVQDAFAQMARDPQFLEEMQKTGFDTGYAKPTDILQSLEELLANEQMRTMLQGLLEE